MYLQKIFIPFDKKVNGNFCNIGQSYFSFLLNCSVFSIVFSLFKDDNTLEIFF